MPVEVFDAADEALALGHVGTGAQSDCVALLAGSDRGVRLMSVAPGSASVDEGFVLAGNVCPVGGSDGYDNVGLIKFIHDVSDDLCVRHYAGRRLVA